MKNDWISKQCEADGFPLMLRCRASLPEPAYQQGRTCLFVVTHTFAKRRDNGLPDADYNDQLFPLDLSLTGMEKEGDGQAVLVETFGGKRHYYFYFADEATPEAMLEEVKRRFPDEELTGKRYADPEWAFIKGFDEQFSLWTQRQR